MLPFGLKIAWFALSFSGMVSCWAVLIAFAKAVGAYWMPVLYCMGVTLLEGIFCLGIIWRMDPYQMPKAFCIAQTIIIGFSTFFLTGICASFAIATTICVLQPKRWAEQERSALVWRPHYILPLVFFPILASTAHIAVTLKLDAVQPSDDLHCDTSNPIWVRFLSYAGTPLFLTVPCFYLSTVSAIRVFRTHKHLRRSRHTDIDIDHFTPFPARGSRPIKEQPPTPRAIPSPSPSMALAHPIFSGREPLIPTLTSPVLSAGRFHLPFSPPPLDLTNVELRSSPSSTAPDTMRDESDSPVSSAFPTFASPSTPPNVKKQHKDEISEREVLRGRQEDWKISGDSAHTMMDSDGGDSLRWDHGDNEPQSKSEIDFAKEDDGVEYTDDLHNEPVRRSQFGMLSHKSRRPPPPNLAPAIWRIILFQFAFTTVQILSSISTIVDVSRGHSTPSPFGTQHLALLLAAWGPVIVFGHLPAVRRQLMFWRR